MFESNFSVDKGTCSYQVLWNAFKRIAAGHSADEKTALFAGAAKALIGFRCRQTPRCADPERREPQEAKETGRWPY
jgi:hypothetical protein